MPRRPAVYFKLWQLIFNQWNMAKVFDLYQVRISYRIWTIPLLGLDFRSRYILKLQQHLRKALHRIWPCKYSVHFNLLAVPIYLMCSLKCLTVSFTGAPKFWSLNNHEIKLQLVVFPINRFC
jgi:hypothetical protein